MNDTRMLDLVRAARGYLYTEELISDEEYAHLAALPSTESHERMRGYDDLRAQLEAVTRERDALLDERRLVALELGCGLRVPLPGRLADVAAHFVAQVRIGEARLTRERDEAQAVLRKCHEVAWPRGGDLNGDPVCDLMLMRGTFQAHITTLERERDAARETIQHGIELRKQVERERDEARAAVALVREECARDIARVQVEARADAARLREALLNAEDKLRSAAHVAGAYVTADRTVAETNWRQLRNRLMEAIVGVRAALASTPSAEPMPRDMRVAEAVREACARIVATRNVENWMPEELANEIRAIDLAAVVTKAVKP